MKKRYLSREDLSGIELEDAVDVVIDDAAEIVRLRQEIIAVNCEKKESAKRLITYLKKRSAEGIDTDEALLYLYEQILGIPSFGQVLKAVKGVSAEVKVRLQKQYQKMLGKQKRETTLRVKLKGEEECLSGIVIE